MKADAWMPLYVNAYLGKTMRLTTEQHGAYLLLIMEGWKSGSKLPDDDDQLAAIAKMTLKDWRKIAPLIRRYFTAENGELTQDRLTREFDKAQRLSEARRETGRQGGRPRKQTESDEKPIGYSDDNLEGSQTETPACVAPPLHLPSPLPSEAIGGGGAQARDDWPEVDPVKALLEAVASPWLDPAKSAGLSTTTGRLAAWRREGATWAGDVLPVVKRLCAERREPISTWKFFDAAIGRSVADSRAGLTIPEGGVVVSMRGLGEQIGAEKAEAKRRTLAMLEARNG